MKALSIIKSEHRNLGAILFSLEKLVEAIEHGKHPDFRAFHGLLLYIDRFLDKYHHPKESNYLFPTLRTRRPDLASVLDDLENEHIAGEGLFVEALKSLSAYEALGESEFGHFRDTVRRYSDFERQHAIKEEKHILPAARESMLPEDWVAIDHAFSNNRDPLFGDKPSAEFEALHKTIATITPSPYGFGPEWH